MKLSSVRQWTVLMAVFPARSIAPRRLALVFVFVAAAISGGCSSAGYYSVQGKVVDPAGQPIAGLEGSQIVFTLIDGRTSSVGEIASDGSFILFTDKPGDGAPPGKYQVHIA